MQPPRLENLVGFWDFNKKANLATVEDLSGNGNDGALINFAGDSSEYLISSRYSQVLDFNNGVEHVNFGDISHSTSKLTLLLLSKIERINDARSHRIIEKVGAFFLQYIGDTAGANPNKLWIQLSTTSFYSNYTLQEEEIYHCFIITYDIDLAALHTKLYIDSNYAGGFDSASGVLTSGNDLILGGADANYATDGQIRIFAMWNCCLSLADINEYSQYLLRQLPHNKPSQKTTVPKTDHTIDLTNHWTIDDNATTITDDIGGDTGTWAGTPALSIGCFNNNHIANTRGFDGTNDEVTCAGTRTLGAYTLVSLAKFGAGARETAFSLGTTGDDDLLSVGVEGGGLAGHDNHLVYAHFDAFGATDWHVADSGFTPDVNRFYYVVGVNDGTDIKLYIDGVEAGSVANGGGQHLAAPTAYFGRRHAAANLNRISGNVTENWLFDRVLSKEEIRALISKKTTTFDFKDGLAAAYGGALSKKYFINADGNLEFADVTGIYRGITYPYSFINGEVRLCARNLNNNAAILYLRFMMSQGGDIETSTHNGYQMGLVRNAPLHTLQHTNGLGGNIFDTDSTAIDSGWHEWIIRKIGSKFTVHFDGVEILNATDATWSVSDKFGVCSTAGAGWEIDYIKITQM